MLLKRKGGAMNVLDTYNCDSELLGSLFERLIVVGDRVDLPDGIYTNIEDELAAVVLKGRFVAELQVYDSYGEARM